MCMGCPFTERSGRDDDDEPPAPSELPRGQVRHQASGEPHDKAQRNFTDPDSRMAENLRPPCGYSSEQSAAAAQELGVTALIPLGRTRRWRFTQMPPA